MAKRTGPDLHNVLVLSAAAAGAPPATPPHHDRGLLTLIASSDRSGLQVLKPGSGAAAGAAQSGSEAWQDVRLGPGVVCCLPGLLLEAASGGAIRAALHRVAPEKIPDGRLSLAFKLHGFPGATVVALPALRGTQQAAGALNTAASR